MSAPVRFLCATCAVCASFEIARAQEPLDVSIRPSASEYVLGEPVILDVVVTNNTDEALRAWKIYTEHVEPEIEVHISADGETFARHSIGIYTDAGIARDIETLNPGDRRRHRLRLLYTHDQPDRLAFGVPGEYWIKVRYPLITPKPLKRTEIESNTTKLTFERPTGIDAKLWEVIRVPKYLYFLQSGLVTTGDEEVVEAAIKIVSEAPDSAYHLAFRWALNRYYGRKRHRVEFLAEIEQGAAIRKALRIEEEVDFSVARDPLGPRDERLERFVTYGSRTERPADGVPVTYGSSEEFRLGNVLRDISRKSGVELRLDEPISTTSLFRSPRKTARLREFMQALVEPGRTMWVRDGDAYVLKLVNYAE